MKAIAKFDGYMGGLAIIEWTGDERLAGTLLYAGPVQAQPVASDDDRTKWTFRQWYEPVGAWETPEGHISFGSPMAVRAMLIQFGRTALAATQSAAAPADASQSKPTDMSRRLRDAATAEVGLSMAQLLIGAADEIERYYGGMLAWKQTAEKKDADWNRERMERINERCAARAATQPAAAPAAQPIGLQTMCAIKAELLAAQDCESMEGIDAIAARIAKLVMRPTDDDLWDATLRDRDTYHDWADKLADAIATHFGADIGEHSNMNCPWAEALEVIEAAAPVAAQGEREADQRRIDACLRAFEGVNTEDIEEGPRVLDVLTARQREINQLRAAAQVQPVTVLNGFSREDLESVAEELECEPSSVNVGDVTGTGDSLLETGAALAARFIRKALAAPSPQPAIQAGEDERDAKRWRFMMAVADNSEGPEAESIEKFGNERLESERPESVQMGEIVDAAITTLNTPQQADSGQGGGK